jgi:hypothetical protein
MPDESPDTSDAPEVAETPAWTPPASQEELDRIISDRLSRATKKYKDYDTLKEQAGRLRALEVELSSESEKAAAKAREETSAAERDRFVPRLVKAEFRANANGLTTDQLDALLEDVDLRRYVDEDGEPDLDRIKRKIAAVAPPQPSREPFNMNDLIRRAAGRSG